MFTSDTISYTGYAQLQRLLLLQKMIKNHGSRQTRLEAESVSASVGTPPPFKDHGADAAPRTVGGEEIRPTKDGQRPKNPFTASILLVLQSNFTYNPPPPPHIVYSGS